MKPARGIARRILLAAAAAVAAVMAVLPAAAAQEGTFERFTLDSHDYYVYTPSSYSGSAEVPLVVYLHGCSQTAPDAALGTRWNEEAEARGFIAMYPEQNDDANATQCWNWAQPNHQQRGSGEAGLIADMTRQVIVDKNIDTDRVFVLGASAGGAMSMVMGATYPDLFAAIGNFAGCGYQTCFDATGYFGYQAMGDHARVVPALIGGGTLDPTYPGVLTAHQQWLNTNDFADDGSVNNSVPHLPTSWENHPSTDDSYAYDVAHYEDAGGTAIVSFATIHGLGHAYPGGNPDGSFTDPKGPAVTPIAYEWFLDHPMG